MGKFRTPTEREANPQRGRNYTDAIIEFMRPRGYVCESRAEISGGTVDLEFTPKVNGSRLLVEAKNVREDQQGLSPNQLKDEFARYFLKWIRNPDTEFHIFVSNTANVQLWKNLVHEEPDSDTVRDFYRKVKDLVDDDLREELERYDPETFEEFVRFTSAWNYTLGELLYYAEEAKETGHFEWDPYLEQFSPVSDPEGELISNLFAITEYPDSVYVFPVSDDVTSGSLTESREHEFGPFALQEGELFTLFAEDEFPEQTSEIVTGEPEERSFAEFMAEGDQDKINLLKTLLKGLLGYKIQHSSATIASREDGPTVTYLPLPEDQDAITRQGRTLVERTDKLGDIRHQALEIKVKYLGGEFYYSLHPVEEFTSDGTTLVSSRRKDQLSDIFSQSSYPQNDRRRKQLQDIVNEFSQSTLSRSALPEVVRNLGLEQVSLATQYRPPKDSDEREQIISPGQSDQSGLSRFD